MEPHFISGIHNYCDRWCERCSFSQRCEIFAEEQKLTTAQRDPDNPAFWDFISNNFRKAMEMLEAWAAKEGIDMEAGGEGACQQPAREGLPPKQQALENLAQEYTRRTVDWLKANRRAFHERDEELRRQLQLGIDVHKQGVQLADAVEVAQWYCTMIASKTGRALHSYEHMDEWYWDNPVQSDANGTAKVALLCIERSLGAWLAIRQHLPAKADEVVDMLVLLDKLHRGLMYYFPDAKKFVRPGFDEPGMR
ncbi:MAG: hypothetical protein KDC66_03665 [Phaeodactylibacter sp.]|nr:hypothetical protein [Phaeodactylibacter sp.]